ncbi:hypothetical protein HPB51_021907 [Rhipicephalus microplus]|uniref:Uncharacterized protein n=1 Tax=Rhipicephalus microplus TaxID=6941 RepID=A0A9J6E3B8_RHIMP|nr:hypothetical protein HPB51_021907 [Rhipicephalus microplus]
MTCPGDQHICSPKSAFCGGPHPTINRTCTQRFETPYIIRQRRRERCDFDKDFPPIHELSDPANKSRSQSRSSTGCSQYQSGPRSTGRSQYRSSSRSRGPAVRIQVPAATANKWAGNVKRSQKQATCCARVFTRVLSEAATTDRQRFLTMLKKCCRAPLTDPLTAVRDLQQ